MQMSCFFLSLFKGSSRCGFSTLLSCSGFIILLVGASSIVLSEQIKMIIMIMMMMMMISFQVLYYLKNARLGRVLKYGKKIRNIYQILSVKSYVTVVLFDTNVRMSITTLKK